MSWLIKSLFEVNINIFIVILMFVGCLLPIPRLTRPPLILHHLLHHIHPRAPLHLTRNYFPLLSNNSQTRSILNRALALSTAYQIKGLAYQLESHQVLSSQCRPFAREVKVYGWEPVHSIFAFLS